MNKNDIVPGVLWLVGMFLVVVPVGALFAFSPQTIVRWQAQFYRTAYKTVLKRSDEGMDQPYQLPWDRLLMGKRSEFIVRGSEAPESYTGLLKGYRILGIAILMIFGCASSLGIMLVFSAFLKTF